MNGASDALSGRSAGAPTRSQLYFGLFLLAGLNGFCSLAVGAVIERGWLAAAANLFDVSAILWLALSAGLKILRDDRDTRPATVLDLALGAGVLAAALLPAPVASTVALTLAALAAVASSAPGTALRRTGLVFLTVSGALLWGRMLLTYFSRPLLDIDAVFVTALIGAEHQGNVIWENATGARVFVSPGCSSLRGLSLALVFWATVNQYYRVRFARRALATLLAALAATIAVNVLRIAAMLRWPEHLDEIHHGWGWTVAMWANLALVAIICLWGARREIFAAR